MTDPNEEKPEATEIAPEGELKTLTGHIDVCIPEKVDIGLVNSKKGPLVLLDIGAPLKIGIRLSDWNQLIIDLARCAEANRIRHSVGRDAAADAPKTSAQIDELFKPGTKPFPN